MKPFEEMTVQQIEVLSYLVILVCVAPSCKNKLFENDIESLF